MTTAMNTATPENPRLADKHAVHFGGCSMRLLVTFILATLMSVGFFDASAAAEEAGPCGLSTGDVAIAACSRLIKGNPKNVFALVSRGNAYKDKGDFDHAISDYNEAIRLNPKYGLAFFNRGNAYLAKNEADRAIVDFNQAIRLDPKNVFALVSRGKAYKDKGDLDRAISDYNEAIRLDAKNAFSFNRVRDSYFA